MRPIVNFVNTESVLFRPYLGQIFYISQIGLFDFWSIAFCHSTGILIVSFFTWKWLDYISSDVTIFRLYNWKKILQQIFEEFPFYSSPFYSIILKTNYCERNVRILLIYALKIATIWNCKLNIIPIKYTIWMHAIWILTYRINMNNIRYYILLNNSYIVHTQFQNRFLPLKV